MILSVLDGATEVISYVSKGIEQIFDFLINLPSFIISLFDVIPSPFKEVILAFSGIIIIYFIAKAVMQLAN